MRLIESREGEQRLEWKGGGGGNGSYISNPGSWSGCLVMNLPLGLQYLQGQGLKAKGYQRARGPEEGDKKGKKKEDEIHGFDLTVMGKQDGAGRFPLPSCRSYGQMRSPPGAGPCGLSWW